MRRLLRIIAILALIPAPTGHAFGQAAPTSAGNLTIRVGGQASTITHATLDALPQHTLTMTEGPDSGTVSGVALWDVLQHAKAVSDQASGRQRAVIYLKVTGADGQSAVVALVEVDPGFSKREALLISRRNGKALDAVEGPWRLILPDDQRHARWIRGVVMIAVESLR